MSRSAIEGRAARRAETAGRIAREARRLADERGLDGFTMEELAEASQVSRRTLFNYFPGKDAAVLGDDEPWDDALARRFQRGGPHGHLVDDLAALFDEVLRHQDLPRAEVARVRRVLHDTPRLLGVVLQRFEAKVEHALRLIERREGPAYDEHAARVVIHVFAALFDTCLTTYAEDEQGPELADLFADAVRAARRAFA